MKMLPAIRDLYGSIFWFQYGLFASETVQPMAGRFISSQLWVRRDLLFLDFAQMGLARDTVILFISFC